MRVRGGVASCAVTARADSATDDATVEPVRGGASAARAGVTGAALGALEAGTTVVGVDEGVAAIDSGTERPIVRATIIAIAIAPNATIATAILRRVVACAVDRSFDANGLPSRSGPAAVAAIAASS